MRRPIFYTIFFIISLFTQCNSCPELTKSADGLYLENGKPFTGETICDCDFNYKGNVNDKFCETEVLNYKDGILDGLHEQYEEDKLTLRAYYKNGVLDGVFEEFELIDLNGGQPLRSKKHYKNGMLDGYSEIYTYDGILKSKKFYKNGKRADGIYLLTEWVGEPLHKADGIFKNGKFSGIYKHYTTGGRSPSYDKFVSGDSFKDSIKDVQLEEYYSPRNQRSKAQIVLKENYKDGIRDGLHESYYYQHSNSKMRLLKTKGGFKDGKKDGIWEGYYNDRILQFKSIYKNGEIDGFNERYHTNGQLYSKEIYNDEKTIIAKEKYFDTGELESKTTFKNEKRSSSKYYYKNGKKKEVYKYINGLLSKNEKYYKNGKISSIYFANVDMDKNDNVKTSITEYYNERGKLTSKEIRKGGTLFSKTVYNNGKFEYIEIYEYKN